jgi:hypothetical protein
MNDSISPTPASTLSLSDLAHLILCPVKAPDGIYSYPGGFYGELHTALIEDNRLMSLVIGGEGQVLLDSDRALVQVVMDVRTAIKDQNTVRFFPFVTEPDPFDPEPEAFCDACGAVMTGWAGLYCRSCQDHVSLWNEATDSLEAVLKPVFALWVQTYRGRAELTPANTVQHSSTGLRVRVFLAHSPRLSKKLSATRLPFGVAGTDLRNAVRVLRACSTMPHGMNCRKAAHRRAGRPAVPLMALCARLRASRSTPATVPSQAKASGTWIAPYTSQAARSGRLRVRACHVERAELTLPSGLRLNVSGSRSNTIRNSVAFIFTVYPVPALLTFTLLPSGTVRSWFGAAQEGER